MNQKLSGTADEISLTELKEANGADGKPAYIAYQGRIINVSDSKLWEGGQHMGSHQAGADLTAEIDEAPHGLEVLERYPQIGVLAPGGEITPENLAGVSGKQDQGGAPGPKPELPRALASLFKRFPLLKRHPHPMVVHFPIVFMISATFFTILYVLTGYPPFETTALNCLGGGVLFTPVAAGTGLLTWWLNYELRPLRPVIIKITLSPILLVIAVIAFIWRLQNPGILAQLNGVNLIYFVLILLLTPLVSAIGWFGAKLTFPHLE